MTENIIEKMPWYSGYMQIIEKTRDAEKRIEELEKPEKQFRKILNFYKYIEADYSKNTWMMQAENDIQIKRDDVKLSELKKQAEFGHILENVVQNRDTDSFKKLIQYKSDEHYGVLVRKALLYSVVTTVKTNKHVIENVYSAICKTYPLEKTDLFLGEGVYYYKYFFQCLQAAIKKYRREPGYENVKHEIDKICTSAKFFLNSYAPDRYFDEVVDTIMIEIKKAKLMLDE